MEFGLQNGKHHDGARSASLDLYSLAHLEVILGLDRARLREVAATAARYYRPFRKSNKPRPFAKKGPVRKRRLIDNPQEELKRLQKKINKRLLQPLVLPEHLLGGIKGKTLRENAERHLTAPALVTVDIKSFFPSVTPIQVYRVWRETLNCSPRVAALLTRLTTFRGYLPQGAPTSTLLANLVLSAADERIRSVCTARSITYSSWVDDLAFSGDYPQSIVGDLVRALAAAGFRVAHKKIKIMRSGERKTLNHLVLGRTASVDRRYLSRIRSGIHKLASGIVPKEDVERYVRGLEGSINYLALYNPLRAKLFTADLRSAVESCRMREGQGA